jgi:predicted DNA-binding antitoxin AbrB/MazE fold protein
MQSTVKAVYQNGILRLLQPLSGLEENSQVVVTVVADPTLRCWAECIEILPDEDTAEMMAGIAECE